MKQKKVNKRLQSTVPSQECEQARVHASVLWVGLRVDAEGRGKDSQGLKPLNFVWLVVGPE